ncbi:BMP family ABC transporter substrate-binding protein [Agromyces allii]|uniref:BMP family ABC transporter substrate-binding protein n=1 Tax=Agromyces allii TaxID=393607 RepID=A0ABN2R5P3_9MICO|nr:BMP family ABC transporter substrate-binding protein [Agromyces allii]
MPGLGRPAAGPVAVGLLLAVGLGVALGASACSIAGTAVGGSGATAPGVGGSIGVLDAGFLGDDVSPSPEATIAPEPGSWGRVEVPAGFRVVVVRARDDAATDTIVGAVEAWAVRVGAESTVLPAAADAEELIATFEQATAADADLVIGAGDGVVDEFAYGTAQHLDQQYLVLGAQLGEPTENVTSVVWPGATFRGTGITDDVQDAAAVTPARAGDAVAAGVAAVLHGVTGVVVSLPEPRA